MFYLTIIGQNAVFSLILFNNNIFGWWLQLYIMAQNSEAGQVNAPGFLIEKWNCLANILISAYHAPNFAFRLF